VLSVTAIALGVAALAAGLTGTWSPCGFSMIDTLGPRGHDGGRRATLAACAAFALGAPVGGVITFGGLSALGDLLQGGGAAFGVAAAIAIAAAALDLAGVRIAPQLRRQVPEGWRRVLPLPLAAFLYGILLGLGFTTYVLSFALPALAAISVAAADVQLGLVVGLAFGVGRALPIVVLAPLADTPFGARAITAMAERPRLLRGTRIVDALALAGVAVALVAAPAQAATGQVARPGTQPSADAGALAWSVPGADGLLAVAGAAPVAAGGRLPALGGGRLAVVTADGTPTVIDRATGAATPVPAAAGADALAVSARWLAWRLPAPDRLLVLDLATPGATPRPIVTARGAGTLSRPALSGDTLAWGSATTRGSTIRALDLATPAARSVVLRRAGPKALVAAPALFDGALLWLRATQRHQELRLGAASPASAGSGRVVLRLRGLAGRDGGRDPGYTTQGVRPEDRHGPTPAARYRLLDTALDAAAAYVSRVPSRGGAPSVVRITR
jgi:cytochrome c biogenesis protein CcdA